MEEKEIMEKIEALTKRLNKVEGTPCEVYSRVVGFFRPVKQWNEGKTEEYHERLAYKLEGKDENIKCCKEN